MKLMKVLDIIKVDNKSALVRLDMSIDEEALQGIKELMQWAIAESQKRFDKGKTISGEGKLN